MTAHGAHPVRTGWVGWIYFGGIVLLVVGVIQFINGLVAFAHSGATVLAPSGTAVRVSYAGVGVSFLIMGVVLAAAGIGVMVGRTWARAIATVLALLSVLANIMLFGASPLWSTLVIVLNVVVIYALTVHGKEVRRT